MINLFPLFIVFSFALQFLVFHGAGLLFKSLFYSKFKNESIYHILFLGLFVLIFVLSFLHFFLPIQGISVYLLFIFFSSISLVSLFKEARYQNFSISRLIFFFVQLLILLVVLVILSLTGFSNYDSGLYHFPVVKWITEFPIVPGIGNLHSRLAFNNTWFYIVSFFKPFSPTGFIQYFLISFWYFILLSYLGSQISREIKVERRNLFFFLYTFLFLLVIHFPLYIVSISPDSIAYFLSIFILTEALKISETKQDKEILILLLMFSALLVSIKIVSLLCILPVGLLCLNNRLYSFLKKNITRVSLLVVFFGLVYCLRGYIMSGYFSYPLPFSLGEVDWSIPEQVRASESLEIKGWARHPGEGYINSLNEPFLIWFPKWYQIYKSQEIVGLTILSLFLSLIASFGLVLIKGSFYKNRLQFQFLLVLGIILWLFNAPDPRFVLGLLLFFVAYQASLLAYIFSHFFKYEYLKYFATIGLILISFKFVLLNPKLKFNPSAVPKIIGLKFPVQNGEIYYPDAMAEQCWEYDLPCAPYRNSKITFRGSSLIDGFKIQ